MLSNTKGIVLRSIKYGETSLIVSVFTEKFGLCSYMIKGIRNEKNKTKRAGLLHPSSLLILNTEHKPNKQLQVIKEFQLAYLYVHLQEDIIRNSIAIFSVEILQKLLPEAECMEGLFHFCYEYFQKIDTLALSHLANLPLFFVIQCGRHFGYNVQGSYSPSKKYLSSNEGVFSENMPNSGIRLNETEVAAIAQLNNISQAENAYTISLNTSNRNNILDWYIEFLQQHTQHLGHIRSIDILRSILH